MAGGIAVKSLDHLVLTVRNVEATCRFYETVLGMRRETFGAERTALHFGRQKINLHPYPSPIDPKAAEPRPGTADLCFLTAVPVAKVVERLGAEGIAVEVGPVETVGAQGPMTSVYFRDPDGNLIELANLHARAGAAGRGGKGR